MENKDNGRVSRETPMSKRERWRVSRNWPIPRKEEVTSPKGRLVSVRRDEQIYRGHLRRCEGGCGHGVLVSLSEESLLQRLPGMEVRCLECTVRHLKTGGSRIA